MASLELIRVLGGTRANIAENLILKRGEQWRDSVTALAMHGIHPHDFGTMLDEIERIEKLDYGTCDRVTMIDNLCRIRALSGCHIEALSSIISAAWAIRQ